MMLEISEVRLKSIGSQYLYFVCGGAMGHTAESWNAFLIAPVHGCLGIVGIRKRQKLLPFIYSKIFPLPYS